MDGSISSMPNPRAVTADRGSGSIPSVQRSTSSFNPDELLTFGAKQIINLFIPVTVCMLFVVLVTKTVNYYTYTNVYMVYTPFHTRNADLGTRTWESLVNVLILMSFIVAMTFVLFLLFKYKCYRFIHGWIILTTLLLLFVISFIFFIQVIVALGLFIDYFTLAFILWNFGAVGMMAIHWRVPLILQQTYLIFIAAQMALMFVKYLPKWTCWVLLGALAVWDLIAVLCPLGPLRMLVELATERNQPLFPALLYSTTAAYIVSPSDGSLGERDICSESPTAVGDLGGGVQASTNESTVPLMMSAGNSAQPLPNTNPLDELDHIQLQRSLPSNTLTRTSGDNPARAPTHWLEVQANLREREEKGIKLGLGDFVFYSLLIGRAALDGDSVTVAACYVAILVGMCLTIIVLGITRRALPALPISVLCGILFYFVSSVVISPFLDAMAAKRLVF